MGCRQRSPVARRRIAALLVALSVAGCSHVSGSSSASGGTVSVHGSGFGTVLAIGVVLGLALESAPPHPYPQLDPSRRVQEQDCTRPLEDVSANLQCR